MKHHIRALLFDLDGVVVTTDRLHHAGWKRLCDELGWDFPSALGDSLRGVGRIDAMQLITSHNGQELEAAQVEELANRKNEYYRASLDEIGDGDLIPGALDFIDQAKAEGVACAICSSSKNAEDILAKLGLTDKFDVVISGNHITRSKPDPEVFVKAAEALGVPAFHCLVLEDAVAGVEGALAAGMKCIGIGSEKELPMAPDVARDFSEIDLGAVLDSGRCSRPEPDGWRLVENALRSKRMLYWESAFAVTNGMLGVRGNLEEHTEGFPSYPATQINGIVGYMPYQFMWAFPGYPERGHRVMNCVEWTHLELAVDGERFDLKHPGLKSHRRWLDMREGVLHREFVFSTCKDIEVKVKTRRLASMVNRHLAAIEYAVEVSGDCQVVLVNRIDAAPQSRHYGEKGMEPIDWDTSQADRICLQQCSHTSGQRVDSLFNLSALRRDAPLATAVTIEGSVASVRMETALSAGESLVYGNRALFVSDLETAVEQMQSRLESLWQDLPSLSKTFDQQAAFWKNYWDRFDAVIEGDSLDQLGVRLSLFHNRQSSPDDGVRSVSANGQTGDNYGGHVFWDTEMYIVPPILYSEPEAVRPLLDYRYSILDKAREQARRMQGKGALYSWNSITGEECAHVYEASTAEYHLQSAVAWAIDRYVDATGDKAYLHAKGAEMIFETARFLRDRGCFSEHKDNRFVINVVCGPNEYSCGVDNNAYTNYLAQWHFRTAAKVAAAMRTEAPEAWQELSQRIGLSDGEVNGWTEAAERMYLPWDEKLGIIPQDDNFLGRDPVDMSKIPLHTDVRSLVHPLNLWRMQLIKQADTVLLLFLFRHLFDAETVRKTYQFHEPKTNHGSSLSACMHAIVASDIGEDEAAHNFFRESALMDINDLKGNTDGGVHSACLGGTWMALVNGFGGMRDTPEGLSLNPRLPKAWQSLAFSFTYRGTVLRVEMTTKVTTVRHLEGPELSLTLSGEGVVLQSAGEVSLIS
jgi:alpha,alpha-trehalose phosphorylase